MPDTQERKFSNVNTLQKGLEAAIEQQTSAPKLLALLIEMKLREAKVRVTGAERRALLLAATESLKTGDPAPLSRAVLRKRKIQISLEPHDYRRLFRRVSAAIEKAVPSASMKLAKELQPRLRSAAFLEAAEDEQSVVQIQHRLMREWRKPMQEFGMFRYLAAHVGESFVSHIQQTPAFANSNLAEALMLLHARACLVAREVDHLIRGGFADGAMARWRSLHEIAVTMAFLVEHGEECATRYVAHFAPASLKAARQYERYRRKLGYGTVGKRFLSKLQAEVGALEVLYGKEFVDDDYGWACAALSRKRVNFAMIEEAVKLDFMRPFYKVASEQVHASMRGATFRSGLVANDGSKLLVGPTNYGFADAGSNSARALLIATVALLRVSPTADTNILTLILSRWLRPLQVAFIRTQARIEHRAQTQAP